MCVYSTVYIVCIGNERFRLRFEYVAATQACRAAIRWIYGEDVLRNLHYIHIISYSYAVERACVACSNISSSDEANTLVHV